MSKPKKASETIKEYRRARAALLRRLSRAREKGMDVSGFKVPKIPKKITKGSTRQLKKLSDKFTQYKKSIPKYGDQMADLVDRMIATAQNWASNSPLSHIAESEEGRIRHRGDEARTIFNQYALSHDTLNRKKLQANVIATWDDLVVRLERFLLESDQYHYDGNLAELADIFIKMLKPVMPYDIPEEYVKETSELVSDFIEEHDWIEEV